MKRKVCKQCGEEKCIRDFYRHSHYSDGHEGICKRCKIEYVRENRELKFEYYREWKRRWSQRPENIAKRKAYANSERGRAVHAACRRRYYTFKRLEARA